MLGTALSGLLLTSCAGMNAKTPSVETAEVMCHGVNSCKGQGACAGKVDACSGKTGCEAKLSCAGKNSCKGKGLIKMSKEECKKKGGKAAS